MPITMRRLFLLLLAALLLTACNRETRNPEITGYRFLQPDNVRFGFDGVTADLVLELDVKNPTASRISLESLDATLYPVGDFTRFADVTMQDQVSIEPRTDATVRVPLNLRILKPLALLSGGLNGFDPADYCADVDLVVKKGSFKRKIQQERIPLDQLGNLLPQTTKQTNDEN